MTDIKNADLPVNPIVNENGHPYHASQVCFDNTPLCSGLSKREAFAMAAMQGLCANQYFIADRDSSYTEIASNAKFMADALLLELSK